jgi:arsenate reductase
MADKVYNVLFLCTGNSARSLLAEAYLNHTGQGRFKAFSAGSFPTGKVNSGAIALLERLQIPTAGLRSKSWDEFARAGAPTLDFIITVCDNAAGEVCPVWPGKPVTAHWGVADPAHVEGELERANAFREAFQVLRHRIDLFTSLPKASLDHMTIGEKMRDIGKAAG